MAKPELRFRVIVVLCILLMVACEVCQVISAQQPSKPHIVLVLVDDWGWANVGYHQEAPNDEVVTPNMDNLVKDGMHSRPVLLPNLVF